MTEETMFAQPEEQSSHREHLLELVRDGKIKYTEKHIKKASESTLEKILIEYDRKQLDEVNTQLAEILIQKFSELMLSLEAIKDSNIMEEELTGNELFKNDVKRLLSYITPHVPLIGLLSGGVTVGKHIFEKKILPEKDDDESEL